MDCEIIVVDGMSTDGTIDILKRYEHQIDQLIIETDEGQADAIHKGILASSGDIIGWLNTDDVLAPGTLKKVLTTFLETDSSWIYGKGVKITRRDEYSQFKEQSMYDTTMQHLNLTRWYRLFQPSVFFRRSLYEDVGGINKKLNFTLDWDLFIRFQNFAKPTFLNEVLAKAHIHPKQKSNSADTCVNLARASEINRIIQIYSSDEYKFIFNFCYKKFCSYPILFRLRRFSFLFLFIACIKKPSLFFNLSSLHQCMRTLL